MTLSITARCERTGQLGVAVTSNSFRWTMLPSHQDSFDLAGLSLVAGGVGAVTAQASSPPTVTTSVLKSLKRGLDARTALEACLRLHPEEFRSRFQVAVVDANGGVAAFTGERTLDWRGHITGDGWVAAGNILVNGRVVDAIGETFESNGHRPLDERLLRALEAGVAAGGDRRGHRGALLRLATGTYLSDIEIRVHDHATPVSELRRLLAAFHSEADVEVIAIRAFGALGAVLEGSRVKEFVDLPTQEAATRLRDVLVEEQAPTDAIMAFDDLLGVLAERPDIQKTQFGFALMLVESITAPAPA